MFPSVSHNSLWRSADSCDGASLLPVSILHFSSQAWLLQYNEGEKWKLLNHLLCLFPSPLAIPAPHSEAAAMWPCLLFGLRFFLPPWSNTQSFDNVLGNCCPPASPLVSWALLPSHHLSFFNIALLAFCKDTPCLWMSPGPCPCFGCSRPCSTLWDHTHPSILPPLEKLAWLYKLLHWKMSFPSNMAP